MAEQEVRTIPSANEFSPGQISLLDTLKIVAELEGDRQQIIEGLRGRFFAESCERYRSNPDRRLIEQGKRAGNVCIGLVSYKLLDNSTYLLTDLGRQLLSIEDDIDRYKALAKHILLELNGLGVLDAIRNLQQRGDRVKKASLVRELNALGYVASQGGPIPESTTDHLMLLKWLREATLLPEKGYDIDEDLFKQLIGISSEESDELASLSKPQRAFLRTLKKLSAVSGSSELFVKDVLQLATIEHGKIFKADQIMRDVTRPLSEMGWLSLSGSGSGRGSHSGKVAAAPKLLELSEELIGLQQPGEIPAEVRAKLNTPLEQIYEDLGSNDTHVKGLALEILATRISYDLGLYPIKFRERSNATSGAEVDLIAEGTNLVFNRWLVQCKNTRASVGLSTLAKEIGMAMLLRAHVIVLVTTGTFSSTVAKHAKGLAETTALQAVLIDKKVLRRHKVSGLSALLDFFNSQAKATMSIKRGQIEEEEAP